MKRPLSYLRLHRLRPSRHARVIDRYLARQIYVAVLFVLVAFLSLFTFLDLVNELGSVGKGSYRFVQALIFVLLGTPARLYELLPICSLIGAIYVFAQMASSSEFTILRASGLSVRQAIKIVLRIGILLVVLTYVIGEYVSPPVDRFAQQLRMGAMGNSLSTNFRSGAWIKDSPRGHTRFINIEQILPDTSLSQIKIYEFDETLRLQTIRIAKQAKFLGKQKPSSTHEEMNSNNINIAQVWQLSDVSETRLEWDSLSAIRPENVTQYQRAPLVKVLHFDELHWQSDLSPNILGAMMVDPDKMALPDLMSFVSHLDDNKQDSERYQIALWKKVIYPFATLVMLLLALPFAYVHSRAGGVSLKVFGGIMLGVTFALVNNLFSHIGLLNHWLPLLTATAPSLLYLAIALISLKWLNRT